MDIKDFEPRKSFSSSVGGGVDFGDWQIISPAELTSQAKEWIKKKTQKAFSVALMCSMMFPSTIGALHGLLRHYEVSTTAGPHPSERTKSQIDLPSPPQLKDIPTETVQSPELQEILNQDPNPNLPAVNFSIIPKVMCSHQPEEHIIMAINHGDLKIGKYGEGVKEAIARKQKVTLIIEQPPRDKPQSLEQWRNYVRQIVEFYQPNENTTFIVGNEINVPDSHGSHMIPNEYVNLYKTAYEEIKNSNPKTRVFLYGEAYYGQGKYLSVILWQLKGRKIPFDGLALHFYDRADKFFQNLAMYRKILRQNNFSGKSIIISELGVSENLGLGPNDEQYCSAMVKLLATASLAIQRGEIEEADWFTAASFSRQDHSLFQFDPVNVGQLVPTESLLPWLLTTRLLHHQILQTERRGLTIFNGETANNKPGTIIWSKSRWGTAYEVPTGKAAYDLKGNRLDSPDQRLISVSSSPVFIF